MVWSSQYGAVWLQSVRAFAGTAIVVQSMTIVKPSNAKIVIVASSILTVWIGQPQALPLLTARVCTSRKMTYTPMQAETPQYGASAAAGASTALQLEVAALLDDVIPWSTGSGEHRAGEQGQGRNGGEDKLGHGSSPWDLGLGFGTWLRQVQLSTCEAGVAERHEKAGERHHIGRDLFIRPMAVEEWR
jgi:hypothetical protein